MTGKPVVPSISLVSFTCPHCGAHAHQDWFRLGAEGISNNGTPFRPTQEMLDEFTAAVSRATGDERDLAKARVEFARSVRANKVFLSSFLSEYEKRPDLINVHASRCYACKKFAFWVADRMVYPYLAVTSLSPNDDLQDDIRVDFTEAMVILDSSARGAAALLRLCIQKLCAQLGEPGKNINDDIASLVKKGLDVRIQRALDIVRVVGNEAVHPGQLDLKDDKATALELARLVNLIADVMITRPKQIDAMYSALPADKLLGIENRDKKP
jgi:hypothetical protein